MPDLPPQALKIMSLRQWHRATFFLLALAAASYLRD
jgi:hypothetical protein